MNEENLFICHNRKRKQDGHRRGHQHLGHWTRFRTRQNLISSSGLLETSTWTANGHQGWVWNLNLNSPFFSLLSPLWVIPFVCLHTLGLNIPLHWHYFCGAGEHQLCPPICCRDRPKHLDPPKAKRKNNSRLRGRNYSLCVCLKVVCRSFYDSLHVDFSSFSWLWVWTQMPGASYTTSLHIPSVSRW